MQTNIPCKGLRARTCFGSSGLPARRHEAGAIRPCIAYAEDAQLSGASTWARMFSKKSSKHRGDEVALQPTAPRNQDSSSVSVAATRTTDRVGKHLPAQHTLRVCASNGNIVVLGHVRLELHHGGRSKTLQGVVRGGTRQAKVLGAKGVTILLSSNRSCFHGNLLQPLIVE